MRILSTIRRIGNSRYLLLPSSVFPTIDEGRIVLEIDDDIKQYTVRIPKKKIKGIYGITTTCFHCGLKFKTDDATVCEVCGWFKCPHCGKCACDLTDKERKILDIIWNAFMGGEEDE